jgi:hypothetical protein
VTAGGEVVIADNRAQKGPRSENWGTANHIAGQGAAADGPEYRISNNRFRSDIPHEVAFVRNRRWFQLPSKAIGSRGTSCRRSGPAASIRKPGVETAARDRSDEGERATRGQEPAAGPAALEDIEAKLRLPKRLFEEG